jgi:chromosome segregation ATPase
MEAENARLGAKLEKLRSDGDPAFLQSTIDSIDQKMGDLQRKIEALNTHHTQKVKTYHTKIEALSTECEVFDRRRQQLEEELDRIHERLDWLTNPFSQCTDITVSPHAARVRIGELKDELKARTMQIENDERQIESIGQEITELGTVIESVQQQNDDGRAQLDQMIREKASREKELQKLEKVQQVFAEQAALLHDLDESKQRVDAENIRLRNQLDLIRAKARQVAIDNRSLKRSLDIYDSELASRAGDGSEPDRAEFDRVLSAFRAIRESLNLIQDASPADVSHAVVHGPS